MTDRRRWLVRLTESAETDFRDISRWTAGAADAPTLRMLTGPQGGDRKSVG